MNKPWSLSFIDQNSILFTEKKGKLFHLDLKNKTISEIKHNLSVLEDGQGGLLDVLYDDKNVYWKGETYPRDEMEEGAKNLPWEKEAYDKTKNMKKCT